MLVAPDDPWSAYARLVVTIEPPDGEAVVVRAAPPGQTGLWPWPTDAVVYVLTAWNPGPVRLDLAENRRRHGELESELAGLAGSQWPASGFDPVAGEHDDGIAVSGPEEEAVLAVADRYGQSAVFAWTPAAWTIVACAGLRRLSAGWAIEARNLAPPGTRH
jgi:hypothetical protein